MAKSKRKVTVEAGNNNNNDGTPPRRPSVFERLGPGSASTSSAVNATPSRKSSGVSRSEPLEVCRNFMRTGECEYGSSCRYHHAGTSKRNKKKSRERAEDLRSKVSSQQVENENYKDVKAQSPSPKRKRSRSDSRKREPENKIKSQVVVTNHKLSTPGRKEERGAWRGGDRTQLDFEEELTLEKKRQQLQRELDLEMQKERLMKRGQERLIKRGHENVIIQKQISSRSSSSSSSSTSSSSSSSSSSSDASSSSSSSYSSGSERKKAPARRASKKVSPSGSSSSSEDERSIQRRVLEESRARKEDRSQKPQKMASSRQHGQSQATRKISEPPVKKKGGSSSVGTLTLKSQQSSTTAMLSSSNKVKQRQNSGPERLPQDKHKKKNPSGSSSVHQEMVSKTGRRLLSPGADIAENHMLSKSTLKKKQTVAAPLPTQKERKRPQHKSLLSPVSRSEGREPPEPLVQRRSRSPRRETGQMRYGSPLDGERTSTGHQGHGHTHRRSPSHERRSGSHKHPHSPTPSSHSAAHLVPEKPEKSNRKGGKHAQNLRKKAGEPPPPLVDKLRGKKMKDVSYDKEREREREQDRFSAKDYERAGQRSPNLPSDLRREPLPPRGHASSPPLPPSLRGEKQGRSSQWPPMPEPLMDTWIPPQDRARLSESRGAQPRSPPNRKEREVARRMGYEEPRPLLATRHEPPGSDRSRDSGRHPPEPPDDRYGRREPPLRLVPEGRHPLLGVRSSKSPEPPRTALEERLSRARAEGRDHRIRSLDETLQLLAQESIERRRPPSPDSKYHRGLNSPSPPHLHSLHHQGRYERPPPPLDWQQERGRRGLPPYSPERKKGLPPSPPPRHDALFDHREFDEPMEMFEFGRRERGPRERLLPPVGRHALDKNQRPERFPPFRDGQDQHDIFDRELPRSRQDFGRDDQRNPDFGRQPDKWESRRELREPRGHLRNEQLDHVPTPREIGRRREEEAQQNFRKRDREDPLERLPLPKRSKGLPPLELRGSAHDFPPGSNENQFGRGAAEPNRRGSAKAHGSADAVPQSSKGNSRERPPRSVADQKDSKSQPRSGRGEDPDGEHPRRRGNKDSKDSGGGGGSSDGRAKPDAKLDDNRGKRRRPLSSEKEKDERSDKRKKPNSSKEDVPSNIPKDDKKGKLITPDEPSLLQAGEEKTRTPKNVEGARTPKHSATDAEVAASTNHVIEAGEDKVKTTEKPAMAEPISDRRGASFSDWSDDSLDILNQNESPAQPPGEPRPPAPSAAESSSEKNVDAPTQADPASRAVPEAQTEHPPPSKTPPLPEDKSKEEAKMTVSTHDSRRHKSRSEGGEDSRGSFEEGAGRARSRDRKRGGRSGRSSHNSSRHTSLERQERSKPATPIHVPPVVSPESKREPQPPPQVDDSKEEDHTQPQDIEAVIIDSVGCDGTPGDKNNALESYDYDPISDDELEALLEEPDDKDGVKATEPAEKSGIIDALDVDWASLMGDKLNRPNPGPKRALQYFSAARVLSRIGVSVAHAGPEIMKRIEKCFQDETKAESTNSLKESEIQVQSEDGRDATKLQTKDQQSKFKLEHDVAAFHAMIVMQKREREAILENIGPYRQALSARRDLHIRRKLCRLRLKHQENTPSMFSAQNIDSDMFRLSLQLFRQHKSDQQSRHQNLTLPIMA